VVARERGDRDDHDRKSLCRHGRQQTGVARATGLHLPKRFRAKHAFGLDPGVDTGSLEENASK
jgi:hypothetical protein